MKQLFFVFLFVISALFGQPKITIITSIFKADDYIEHFLKEIGKQSIYNECEHIIINPSSPGNEETFILDHINKFPNARYIILPADPGLYGVWNIGIVASKSDLILTANVDDQLKYTALEELHEFISAKPEIDLVYGDIYLTSIPNQTFSNCLSKTEFKRLDFSLENLKKDCSPGPHPLFRKSLLLKYGLFNQEFKILGDYELWIRAALAGAKFQRYPHFISLFYEGENTLSNSKKKQLLRKKENMYLQKNYKCFWKEEPK